MTYANTKPISSFSIVSQWATDRSQHQQHLAKCVTKAATTATCYTATMAHLYRSQLVFINNNQLFHRPIITSTQSSFWGVYKIN